MVDSYVKCVKNFLTNLPKKPVVVDLGCGDFNIGQHFLTLSERYIGCDVVPSLIEFNKKKYISKNLSFVHLDAAKDELPEGEIVIIRQVLQHLSNSQIQEVLNKGQIEFQVSDINRASTQKKRTLLRTWIFLQDI